MPTQQLPCSCLLSCSDLWAVSEYLQYRFDIPKKSVHVTQASQKSTAYSDWVHQTQPSDLEYPAGRLTETSRFNRMCPVAGCPGCPVGRLAGWPVEPGNRETSGSAGGFSVGRVNRRFPGWPVQPAVDPVGRLNRRFPGWPAHPAVSRLAGSTGGSTGQPGDCLLNRPTGNLPVEPINHACQPPV